MIKRGVDPRLRFFKDLSRMVNAVIDLDTLLDTIVDSATKVMQAKASSLLLVDKKTSRLMFHITTGEKKEEIKKFELEKGEGIAGWVVDHGTPLLVPDVKKDPRWSSKISQAIGFETKSIACAPMKVEDEVIGVIEIIDREDGEAIPDEDLEILVAFADLAATFVLRAQVYTELRKENTRLRKSVDERYQIIGESEAFQKVLIDCQKIAPSKATTVIIGESGTGKELIANLIHQLSPRKNKPFIVLNCGALPESLLERELFGNEKGAFTGADSRKTGLFEAADGGTLFLDEIGEISPNMQVKLLRVLQESTFYRVGGVVPVRVDVRVISATNKQLDKLVEEGLFREDLYYRLNVVRLHLPPLRERREDIPTLANFFLNRTRQALHPCPEEFTPQAMEIMSKYHWPGNVRQLENAIERAAIMSDKKMITAEDLPFELTNQEGSDIELGLSLKGAQDRFKRDYIKRTMLRMNGNKTKTAKVLDIQRTYLSRLIKELQIKNA